MEVILVKPVRKLGKIGEIIKVKDGFGRNYLIPQKLAIRATEANKQLIDQQKHDLEEKDKKLKVDATNINTIIKDKELIFIRQAADDGKLFGSVSNKDIAASLSKIASVPISYLSIILDKQIKSIGVFTVEARLHAELSTNITVIVARTESEAGDYLRASKTETPEPAGQDTI